jgi:dUTP pyrophosphatase
LSSRRGELHVILVNLGGDPFEVKRGARIAQLVLAPVVRADIHAVPSLGDEPRGFADIGKGASSELTTPRH